MTTKIFKTRVELKTVTCNALFTGIYIKTVVFTQSGVRLGVIFLGYSVCEIVKYFKFGTFDHVVQCQMVPVDKTGCLVVAVVVVLTPFESDGNYYLE